MEYLTQETVENPGGFDIRKFLFRLFRNYPWFLLSMGVCLTAAYFYLKEKEPMHQVSTFILLHPEELNRNGPNNLSVKDDEIVMTNENIKEMVNSEVFILKSRSLIRQVVDSLSLPLSVYQNEKKVSLDDVPFLLHVQRKNKEKQTPLYTLEIAPEGYRLKNGSQTLESPYGRAIRINGDTVMVQQKSGVALNSSEPYAFQLAGLNATINKYVSRINVTAMPKSGVGMVQVAVQDELYDRARQIIEVLIYQFNLSNLQYKNQAERMALDFLNKRIDALEAELKVQENQVSSFKAQNKIYDVSEAATQLLNSLGTIDVQKNQNDLKENLLTLVEKNVKSYNGAEEIVPNNSGLQDAVLSEMINQYNKLVLNKRMIQDQGAENDPRLFALNGQLEQLRNNIVKNVGNIRRELTTTKYSLGSQERSYASRFERLPRKEKEYIELSRSLGIKESLYVYLLQKREESNLRLVSSDMAQSRIIDEGVYNGVVSPNKRTTYLAATAAGLFLPALTFLLLSLFKNRIETREEIETSVLAPIAGEIGLAPRNNKVMIVSSGREDPIAEQLRSLRANLFYEKEGAGKVLLVTSFMRGEGKSFISLNVADAIAVTGKKVVLLDFDLRKAILSQKLQRRHYKGLSNFLVNDAAVDQIIYQFVESKNNISFIPSGDSIEYPGELILSERMPALFEYLNAHYDYIIVDTPPVGAVSDAITIANWANATLYILRHNYSLRSSVKLIRELHQSAKLPNVSLVINGIRKGGGYQYGGFGYGYNYERYGKEGKSQLPLN